MKRLRLAIKINNLCEQVIELESEYLLCTRRSDLKRKNSELYSQLHKLGVPVEVPVGDDGKNHQSAFFFIQDY